MRPKVAFIGSGGTISSRGADSLQLLDYASAGHPRLTATEILARIPEAHHVADIVTVDWRTDISTDIGFAAWQELLVLCDRVCADHPDLDGIVIGHGTSSMEETAYFLDLTLKVAVPVVLTGSQRPISALSSDAGMNLVSAMRVAGDPAARGMGVLVVLNDEINAARDVTKTATMRLQTFRTADWGALGHADGDGVRFRRRPLHAAAPDTPFDLRPPATFPRVDISYAHVDGDGVAVDAFVSAGARGIVSAGFAPGSGMPGERDAIDRAIAAGVVVVQSSRAGSGRVPLGRRMVERGILSAGDLSPHKARILLACALTVTRDRRTIQDFFHTY